MAKKSAQQRSEASRATEMIELLMAVGRNIRNLMHLEMMEIDVLPGQDQLIMALGQNEQRKLSKIAADINIRPSTASKMVDHLEAKGWVIREKIEGDMRAVSVRITPTGMMVRDQIEQLWSTMDRDLAVALEGSPMMRGADLLEKVDSILRSRLARVR